MTSPFQVIAIDGGAGTGKSTTSSLIAKRLNFLHVDTGSHYRSITKYMLDANMMPEDIKDHINGDNLSLSSKIEGNLSRLSINNRVYSKTDLRSKEINQRVSEVASYPEIREILFNYQRLQVKVGQDYNFYGLVMEGRDIGTIILPEANLKVFLVADQKVRESRRLQDGESDQIAIRDTKDSNRAIAPLVESQNSLRIDTSVLSIEEVFSTIRSKLKIG